MIIIHFRRIIPTNLHGFVGLFQMINFIIQSSHRILRCVAINLNFRFYDIFPNFQTKTVTSIKKGVYKIKKLKEE